MTTAFPLGHEPLGLELEAEGRFRVHYERNVSLSIEMSFFGLCPFNKRHCTVPKNGMNCPSAMSPSALSSGPKGSRPKGNQPIKVVCGLDSSGFSGQWSKHHQGIAKKDISMLTCI